MESNDARAKVRTEVIHELTNSFSRIYKLPRLDTIDMTFYVSWHDLDCKSRLALQTSILGALEASFGVRASSKLTSLSLLNLYPSVFSSFESSSLQTVLTTLRCLKLSVYIDRTRHLDTAVAHWLHFWGTLCPHIILAPTQLSLTELTLHSSTFVGASSRLSLTWATPSAPQSAFPAQVRL
ncbi:hypothetical protein EI94DRAFT_1744370 [Lactarius quietus]|nr:hypothetical protein EI94DRAFT_1744370 [Lactarius quietus]